MVSKNLPMHWRKFQERYNLKGNYCETCGSAFFPGVAMCPTCRRKGNIAEKEMPRNGKILSYTTVFVGPTGFENETPYHIAIIELENAVRVLAQVVDTEAEKIKIGVKVKKVFRKIMDHNPKDAIVYGYKFKVVK